MVKRLFLNDKFILILVLVNSVILVIGGYQPVNEESFAYSLADNSITILFIIELLIKVKEYGFKNYFKSVWNKFDFYLVLLSVPSLITFAFNLSFVDFSFLLVFRILRVFKAFRFFKFIPNVNHLVKGIHRALKSSIFVLIGFAIYIFIIGILSFYLFHGSESQYFKNPLIALYSVFKIFTVEGWFEIPEDITEHYSDVKAFFTYIYFIFIVLTGGIFGLSLVNSIFVDSMVSDNNDELEVKIDNLENKVSDVLTELKELNKHHNT